MKSVAEVMRAVTLAGLSNCTAEVVDLHDDSGHTGVGVKVSLPAGDTLECDFIIRINGVPPAPSEMDEASNRMCEALANVGFRMVNPVQPA